MRKHFIIGCLNDYQARISDIETRLESPSLPESKRRILINRRDFIKRQKAKLFGEFQTANREIEYNRNLAKLAQLDYMISVMPTPEIIKEKELLLVSLGRYVVI